MNQLRAEHPRVVDRRDRGDFVDSGASQRPSIYRICTHSRLPLTGTVGRNGIIPHHPSHTFVEVPLRVPRISGTHVSEIMSMRPDPHMVYYAQRNNDTTTVWRGYVQDDGMQIDLIVCPATIAEKLVVKHHLSVQEARYVVYHAARFRFAETGYTPSEDVYAAYGQTIGGRYIVVFFVYKPETATALIISGRDMSDKERKRYGHK